MRLRCVHNIFENKLVSNAVGSVTQAFRPLFVPDGHPHIF